MSTRTPEQFIADPLAALTLLLDGLPNDFTEIMPPEAAAAPWKKAHLAVIPMVLAIVVVHLGDKYRGTSPTSPRMMADDIASDYRQALVETCGIIGASRLDGAIVGLFNDPVGRARLQEAARLLWNTFHMGPPVSVPVEIPARRAPTPRPGDAASERNFMMRMIREFAARQRTWKGNANDLVPAMRRLLRENILRDDGVIMRRRWDLQTAFAGTDVGFLVGADHIVRVIDLRPPYFPVPKSPGSNFCAYCGVPEPEAVVDAGQDAILVHTTGGIVHPVCAAAFAARIEASVPVPPEDPMDRTLDLIRAGTSVKAACDTTRVARSSLYARRDNDRDGFGARLANAIEAGERAKVANAA